LTDGNMTGRGDKSGFARFFCHTQSPLLVDVPSPAGLQWPNCVRLPTRGKRHVAVP
jgi:hypothetical protein